MDNGELKAPLEKAIEALEGIELWLHRWSDRQADEEDRRELARRRIDELHARASPTWPWTPETVTQGFLAGRWLRLDGDVYGGAALRAVPGPNSPIAGGDDDQAKISVPSGVPRVK